MSLARGDCAFVAAAYQLGLVIGDLVAGRTLAVDRVRFDMALEALRRLPPEG